MAVIDHAFNNYDSRLQRVLRGTAHAIPYLLAINVLVHIPLYFGYESVPLALIGVGLTVLAAAGPPVHHELARLCIRCMEDVPPDAARQAQRYRWFLRFDHWSDKLRTIIAFALVMTVGVIFYSWLPVAIAVDSFLTLTMFSMWIHHRLRPWCPYCTPWDEGGQHEAIPDPVE
ncbi:hypothetical protein ACWIGI_37565 [Nocardia sp. NPDC055321]